MSRLGRGCPLDRRSVVGHRSGSELSFDQVAYRRPAHHVAHPLYRPCERVQILGLDEIFRKDQRMRCRIRIAQQDMSAAERPAGTHHHGKAVAFREQVTKAKPDASARHQRRDHYNDRIRDGE